MRRPVAAGPYRTPAVVPLADVKRELTVPACRGGGVPGAARRLASGVIGRDEYVRQTAKDYDSLAKRLEGFWRLPRAVEHEDVVQELYLATFDWIRRWDPARAPIGRFLVFNAMAETKKWLNRQRRARKGSDPSMHEELIDDVFARDDGTAVDPGELIPMHARQDALPLLRELLAGVDFDDDGGDAECLLALLFEDSDADAAATVVDSGLAATTPKAHARIERVRARAAAILAQ